MRVRDYVAALVVAVGLVLGAFGTVAHASVARPAEHARVLPYTLAYKSHQLLCTRRLAGQLAVVTGDGRPFVVRCDQDGPAAGPRAWVWDAVSA
jgi:hypothetical protein